MTVHTMLLGPVTRGPHTGLVAAGRRAFRRARSVRAERVSFSAKARAYRALLGTCTCDRGRTVTRRPTADEVARATADARACAVLLAELVPGRSAPHALLTCVRRMVGEGSLREARALVSAGRRVAGLSEAAHAAGAVLAVARGRLAEAEDHLRGVSRPAAVDLVPAELVTVEYAMDPALALDTCRTLLADPTIVREADTWTVVSRTWHAYGAQHLSRQARHRPRSWR